MMLYRRPHHQKIAFVLQFLRADLLAQHSCYFAGGTAIALCYGEFRESVDIDFLIADKDKFLQLRGMLTESNSFACLFKPEAFPLIGFGSFKADQYGLRSYILLNGQQIKMEIILEGRIELEPIQNPIAICDISVICDIDMAASKLLANADRWADRGVFNRDLIDLAMMQLPPKKLRKAISKAELAYKDDIRQSLAKAIQQIQNDAEWLPRCMQMLSMEMSKAELWEKIRKLKKVCH